MPRAERKTVQLAGRTELKIHRNELKIAISEKEVGGFDGFGSAPATRPKEIAAGFETCRLRIEGVTTIDQSHVTPTASCALEEAMDEKPIARTGVRADNLGDCAFGDILKAGEGRKRFLGKGVGLRDSVRRGKAIAEQATKINNSRAFRVTVHLNSHYAPNCLRMQAREWNIRCRAPCVGLGGYLPVAICWKMRQSTRAREQKHFFPTTLRVAL